MKYMYELLCILGFHDWEQGEGWSHIAPDVDAKFNKRRCRYCELQERKEGNWVLDDSSNDDFSA